MAIKKNNPGMATVPRAPVLSEPPAGASFISDYVSGTPVRATPKEAQAVQIFARRLVENYGYRKDQIQTRPQYRVCIRPSDEDKSYPVDIAVFRSCSKSEHELFMVAECKKKERKDGRTPATALYGHVRRRGGRVVQRRMNSFGGAVRVAPVCIRRPDSDGFIRLITEFAGMLEASP